MYIVGADDPKKDRSLQLVQQALIQGETLVTDVEVFQEILHRYGSIRKPDAIKPAFETLQATVERTLGIELPQVLRARDIILSRRSVSARDAIHLAVMETHGIGRIMTFDAGFDQFPGITRLS